MVTDKKFTKGEWINLGYRVDVDIADGLSGICEMSDWMPKEQMEANAKLIAAAPEMYSALESSLQMLEQTIKYRNANGIRMGNVFLEATISQVKEAIKKATE